MNENIKLINSFADSVNNRLNRIQLKTIITQQMTTLLSLSSRIASEHEKYINAINLAKYGILSPEIITPKTLYDELPQYKGEYSLLMAPNYNTIHVYYKLLEMQAISINI